MGKARAADIARIGLEWAAVKPPIPYKAGGAARTGADCQGFVKACVAEAGGKAAYSGSNAMFCACLKAGAWWTFADAKKNGKIVKGALPFMWANDGGEVERGYKDGLGNASHVGIYAGQSSQVWSVDASESAGCVRTRTERDAPHVWTHIGWLPEISYDDTTATTPPQTAIDQPTVLPESPNDSVSNTVTPLPMQYTVIASSVNLRKTPSTNATIRGRASAGETLLISKTEMHGGRLWGASKTKGSDGRMIGCWVAMDDGTGNPYLQQENAPEPPRPILTAEPPDTLIQQPTKDDPLDRLDKLADIYIKLNNMTGSGT